MYSTADSNSFERQAWAETAGDCPHKFEVWTALAYVPQYVIIVKKGHQYSYSEIWIEN